MDRRDFMKTMGSYSLAVAAGSGLILAEKKLLLAGVEDPWPAFFDQTVAMDIFDHRFHSNWLRKCKFAYMGKIADRRFRSVPFLPTTVETSLGDMQFIVRETQFLESQKVLGCEVHHPDGRMLARAYFSCEVYCMPADRLNLTYTLNYHQWQEVGFTNATR